MKKTLVAVAAVFLFTAWLSAGCGYTTRSMMRGGYRTISVGAFTNKIDITRAVDAAQNYRVYRPMLETDITKAVINKYLTDGNLKPVTSEEADLMLKGELVEFRRDALRYSSSNEVDEYRLNLVVNLELWDTAKNQLVWQENNFTGDKTYFVTGYQAISEDAAITEAIADLSRRIVERTVEQW